MGSVWPAFVKYTLLAVLPIAICLYALYYIMFKETHVYRVILLACVIGGGMGNLADRLFNGFKVIDFLNFGIGNVRTGILNVADLSVTFGVLILAVVELSKSKNSDKKPET